MPRLCPDRAPAAFGLGAFLAAMTLAAGALAQTSPPAFPENGSFDPPGGQGVLIPEDGGEAPSLMPRNVPTFGNPPAHGASKTGFDSTNARRKIQSSVERKNERQPLPRVVTTQITPVQRLPPTPVVLPARPADPDTTASIAPPYAPTQARPKPKQPAIDPYEPLGIRAGSFLLRPAIDLSFGYDSNPGRDATPKGSPFYVVAPELQAKSDWERHEFRAKIRGSYDGYTEQPSLNRPYFDSVLDGRIDVTSQTRVELQNRVKVATDTPGTPEFVADVAKPTLYTNIGGTAGLFHRFNRLEVGGKASIDRTRYEDSELTDGTTLSNGDRSFTAYGLELRGSYEMTPGVKPFVAVAVDQRVHDAADPRLCQCGESFVERDSQGLTPRIGTTFELSRQLNGDVSIGYMTRRYEDPQLQDLKGVIADASLIWSATALTKVTFTARTSVYESTEREISGVLSRDFGAQVDHAFRDWLIGTLKFGYGLDDYVGSLRIDQRLSAAAGLTYKMNRNVQLKGEVRREQRNSNAAGEDYAAHIVMLGLRLQH
ncbi:MAG TPA: outer membrane beta-barrel protein [Xanthobacteraceae bacterium]|nr:outer membrane beta-barrel protein [Xanthobacteraceae bacterium]